MTALPRLASALSAGLLFGAGLALSGMMNPARVLGFLDVAGAWDPGLAFVLVGAVAVSATGYRITGRLKHPLAAPRFALPTSSEIDRDLVVGSALFGIGWGLVGLCPGPALAGLTLGIVPIAVFAVAMLTGMLLHKTLAPLRSGAAGRELAR